MIIGKFTTQDNGTLAGTLDALLGFRKLAFIPNVKGADYTVMTEGGCEVGAAWKRTSKDGKKAFISVRLDGLFLPGSVNCALFTQADGTHTLVWDRDDRKAD